MAVSSEAIRALVEPALASSGLELWDVEVSPDAVRVLVDRPGGIDLDALASVAGRVVSPLLDEHPDLTPPGRFSLEVSSPGVERDLRRPDHYARYLGTEISVKTTEPVAGARRHHGNLIAADEQAIRLEPKDGPAGQLVELPLDRIQRARTVLVWGQPAAKPGRAGKSQTANGPQTSHGPQSSSGPHGSNGAVKRPAAPGLRADEPVVSNDSKDSAQ